MRYISRFKNSIRASSVYSLAFMLTFALAAGLTTYEEAAAQPSITLSVSPTSLGEDAEQTSVNVTATLSGGAELDVATEITLSFSGSASIGNATDHNDYRAYATTTRSDPVSTITFNIDALENTGTGTVYLNINDDAEFEGDEQIVIRGSSDGGHFVDQPDPVTITENDYEFHLSTTPATFGEGAKQAVVVTATLQTDRVASLTSPVTVRLSVEQNARYAMEGDLEIKLGSGETSDTTELTFTPVDDEYYSSPLSIGITGTATGYNILGTDALMLTDNDPAPMKATLTSSKTELVENGGPATVTITGTISQGSAFADKAASITLAVADTDFYTVTGTKSISIPAQSKTGTTTLTITPKDNAAHGADMDIVITGTSGDLDDGDTDPANDVASATITLKNDDFDGDISVSPASISEGGDATEVTVTVRLRNDLTEAVNVTLSVAANNNDNVNDYEAVWKGGDMTAEIAAGDMEGTATLVVTPMQDDLFEGNETIVVSGASTGQNYQSASITLADDETKPSVALSVSPSMVNEGASETFTVTADLTGDTVLSEDITVTLNFTGSATMGEDGNMDNPGDYTVTGAPITIAVGTSNSVTQSVTIDAMGDSNDDAFEGNEMIIIGGTADGYDVTSADPITLVDDDYELRLFTAGDAENPSTATITENGGEQTVKVTAALQTARVATLGSPLTVTLSVEQNARYSVTGDLEIKLGSGETEDTTELKITPMNDELYSSPLTFSIEATAPNYNILGTSVTLNDNENAPVNAMLSVDKSELAENGGSAVVRVTANISNGDAYADKDATITLGGLDDMEDVYTITGEKSITIASGSKTGYTNLTIAPIDNNSHGANVAIEITGTSSDIDPEETSNDPDISPATVTIVNDDFDGTITISPASISESAGEDQELTVTVNLNSSLSLSNDIVVNLTPPSNDEDISGVEWEGTDSAVEIAAGDMEGSATLIIDLNNDTLYEGNESYMVTGAVMVDNAAFPINLKPGRFTVTDDETKPSIALSVSPSMVTEGGEPVDFTVTAKLSGDTTLEADVTVTLNFDGTASKGTDAASAGDYLASGTLTIDVGTANTNTTTVMIAANAASNDDEFEGNETIIIGGTTNGYDVTAASAITLVDDDYELSLYTGADVGTTATITENGGEQTVTVTAALDTERVTSLTSPLTVTVSVEAGARYSVSGDTEIKIGSGETSDTTELTFTPVDDELYSSPLTIDIEATTAAYNILGSSVSLTDDEVAPINAMLSVDKSELAEDGGVAVVMVTASISQGDAYADKDAKITLGGLDDVADVYTVTGEKSVTIPAGSKSASTALTITPIDNAAFGADVTITITGTSSEIDPEDSNNDADISSAMVTIVNDDFDGTISVSPSSISEGAGEGQELTVTVNLGTKLSYDVSVALTEPTADTDLTRVDWKDNDMTVVIAAGETEGSATLVLTIADDTLYEGNESYTVTGVVTPVGLNLKPGQFTVTDNETKPSIALSVSPSMVTEGASSQFDVTAKLSGTTTLEENVTVTLNYDGTASRGTGTDSPGDYQTTGATTIEVGTSNSVTEQVTIDATGDSNDSEFEGNETIIIGGTTNGYDVTDASEITLVDDDYELDLFTAGDVQNQATASISEGDGEQTVTVTAALRTDRVASLTSPLTVTLSVEQGSRYSVSGDMEIKIGSGETMDTTELTFTPVNDELYSDPLTIDVEASTSNYNILGSLVTLNDDELQPMKASLSVDNTNIAEDGGPATVVVTGRIIQGDAYADKEAKIALGGLDDVENSHSVTGEKSITIPAGSKTGSTTLTISPVDNEAYAEDVVIEITGTSSEIADDDDTNTDINATMVTIVNDDNDGYITTDVSEIQEAGGEVEVKVTANLNQVFTGPVIVDFNTIPGENDADIESGGVTWEDNPVTIAAGDMTGSATLKITPTADSLFEGDEEIRITSGGDGTTPDFTLKDAIIVLRDAQKAMITLTADVEEIEEAGGPVDVTVTATQSGKLSTDTVVTLSKAGTAEKGVDYMVAAASGDITIPAGATEAELVLTITPDDDLRFEGEDGETIVIGGSTPDNNVVHTATIALIDNDAVPLASVMVDVMSISEGDGATTMVITAILGGTSGEEIEIGLSKPGTAVPGEDFTISLPVDPPPAFAIAAGDTMAMKTVIITPIDDMVYEGDEILKVMTVAMLDGADVGDPVITQVPFTDNEDVPTVTLAVAPTTMAEGESVDFVITATASGMASMPIAIELVKSGGTAQPGADFELTAADEGAYEIDALSLTSIKNVTLMAHADMLYEGDEVINVGGTASIGETDVELTSADITLTDGDMVPTITIAIDPAAVEENGGPQVVTITASATVASAIAIPVGLAPVLEQSTASLADGGADPAQFVDPIIIAPGTTEGSKMVTVVPVDDEIYEGPEHFVFVGLVNGTTPTMPATITINDDETMPEVALSTDVTEVMENGAAQDVVITATLSGLSSMDISVELAKDGGSAVKGEDFDVTAGEGTITVAAGDLAGSVTVTIEGIDDVYYEGDETIQIDGTANGVAASPAMVTLVDDEALPTITLTAAPDMIAEGGGPQVGIVTATASGLAAFDLHVGLIPLLQHSTATLLPGPDMDVAVAELAQNPNIAITIPAKQSSGNITLTIIPTDDSVYETNEYAVFAGNLMGTISAPVTITIVDDDAPAIALSANPTTLREDGGTQSVTFDVLMSGITVPIPTVISLTKGGTATKGTDYVPSGNAEITIPAGALAGSTTLGFAVADDDVYEPSNETIVVSANWDSNELDSVTLTIVDNFPAPAVTTAIPDMVLEAGDSRQADLSASFSGKVLTFSASSSGSEVSADVNGSSLSITANRKGAARVTVTASNAAGSASFEIGVTVTAIAAERMVYTDILAAMGRGIMTSVSNTIGGRFSVTAAERQIALANRRVDGMAAGMEAMISLSGTQETRKYGITDDTTQLNNRQPVTTRDLMRGTSFYYALDDAPQSGMNGGLSFTIWGAGDWNAFEGSPSATSTYDGTLTAGYLGVDVSKTASWIAGVAVGRTMGTADYDVSVTDGTLEATLNSVYPYVHWTGPGCCIEIWGIGGFGTGEVEVSDGKSDLSMSLGMLGVRAQLVGSASGGLDLDLIGDAGITKLSTADSESASLSDLEASVQRVRVGLEASRTSDMGNGMLVTPFAQVAGRYDGGDGQTGNGLEVAGGLRIAGGRAGLEARGRFLAMHTGEEVKEHGVAVVAYVRPMGAGGQGLSMSIAPRIGADTDMSGGIWREDPMNDVTRSSRTGAGVKAEIGYGLTTPMLSNLLVTPFGTMDMAGEDQRRMRLGARFGSIGDTTSILSFELTGERIDGNGRTADHRIGLLGRMSF